MSVVLAVVGDPREDRSLHRHRAEHGEGVLERLRGLERTVGEQAMKADRDPDRGDQVHEGGDREDAGADQARREEDDGDDRGDEGDDHPGQVGALLDSAHFAHLKTRYAYLGYMY